MPNSNDMRGIIHRSIPIIRSYLTEPPVQSDPANWMLGIQDHFDTGSLDPAWSWAAYGQFNGAPTVIDVGVHKRSILKLDHNNITHNHFLSRPLIASTYAVARVSIAADSYGGVRVDDGTDNNYTQLVILNGTAVGTCRITRQRRIGGGAVSSLLLADNLPQAFYNLAVSQTTVTFCLYSQDTVSFRYIEYSAFTISPTRAGIVFSLKVSAGGDRAGFFDWFAQAPSIQ